MIPSSAPHSDQRPTLANAATTAATAAAEAAAARAEGKARAAAEEQRAHLEERIRQTEALVREKEVLADVARAEYETEVNELRETCARLEREKQQELDARTKVALNLDEVNAALTTKNYDEAITKLTEATTKINNCSQCYVRLGDVYYQQKDLSKSEEAYKKAQSLDPNDNTVLFNLGVLLEDLGDGVRLIAIDFARAASHDDLHSGPAPEAGIGESRVPLFCLAVRAHHSPGAPVEVDCAGDQLCGDPVDGALVVHVGQRIHAAAV